MTVNEAKQILVDMGFMPGKVDESSGWIHVWSAEVDPRTKYFKACVTYEKETGHLTENRLNGQGRYYKYDNGTLPEKDDGTLKKKGDGFFASLKKELLRGWKG